MHCYRETINQPRIHIYLPPTPLLKHTTFSCGSVYLKHLRNSPFSTNDFLFVDHYGYSCFTWNHNHCHYNRLSVMCKADVMSRRHSFSFSFLLLHRLPRCCWNYVYPFPCPLWSSGDHAFATSFTISKFVTLFNSVLESQT